jgi:hypothetical protein
MQYWHKSKKEVFRKWAKENVLVLINKTPFEYFRNALKVLTLNGFCYWLFVVFKVLSLIVVLIINGEFFYLCQFRTQCAIYIYKGLFVLFSVSEEGENIQRHKPSFKILPVCMVPTVIKCEIIAVAIFYIIQILVCNFSFKCYDYFPGAKRAYYLRHVSLFVSPHVSAWLPPDIFVLNLILGTILKSV